MKFFLTSNTTTEETRRKQQKTENPKQVEQVATRPRIMPDKYDGNSDWRDYVSHFESCCEINSWDGEEAAKYLAPSLRGPALRLLEEQRGTKWNYEEIKKKLSVRFSSAKQSESYLLELRNRKRHQNESLQELGRDIRELTTKAYPNFDTEGVDRLAKIHFTDAILNADIRMGIFHAKAATLDETIQAALTTETFLQTERERRGWKRNTHNRGITSENTNSGDMEAIIKAAVEKAVGDAMTKLHHDRNIKPTTNHNPMKEIKPKEN